MVVTVNSTVVWDWMTCSLVDVGQCCRGITCLHYKGKRGLKEEGTGPAVPWYLSTEIRSFTQQKLDIIILFSYTVTYHKSPVPDHHITTVQTYLIIMSSGYKHT
jgi:hypothetical protein